MSIALAFFVHYAYVILFLWVLVEQIGVPIPSIPVLLTAGTLVATHQLRGTLAVVSVLAACALADSFWYTLGRRYGNAVLRLLCRLSFEADTCVTKTEGYFHKRGAVTLLFAKFIPGLSTVAAPIAGQTGMPYARFIAYDLSGSLLLDACLCSLRLLLRRYRQAQRTVFRHARTLCRRHLRRHGARPTVSSHLEAATLPDERARVAPGACRAARHDRDRRPPGQHPALHRRPAPPARLPCPTRVSCPTRSASARPSLPPTRH